MLRLSLLLAVLPAALAAQQLATTTDSGRTVTHPPLPAATATTAMAVRAQRAPVIDGRDDDPVWRRAQPITGFREFEPVEDGPARFRTMAKVAYDDRNFYVFVRAYDPHPDSIMHALSRRDVRGPSDQIKIVIDAYHDRRTGVEMAVNPDGVKRDYAIYDDMTEDDAWDGVWDAATRVDSLGWTAEFRVPLSQLRYANVPTHTFGFAIWRDIERFKERVSWPVYRYSRAGFASQLGDVTGIVGIPSPHRLEVTPYMVTKNVSELQAAGSGTSPVTSFDHPQQLTGGADLKYGVTSNLTLDATINPDFGQVEADPSVLNLTQFETYFPEKRPFFLEGAGTFRFDVTCSNGVCSGLFYSRRIGRAPELARLMPDAPSQSPPATTILGAAKLTGRLPTGTNVGVLDAVTSEATGRYFAADGAWHRMTISPRTNFAVLTLQQDFRNGQSGIGAMVTGADRALDDGTSPFLARGAYTGGVNFRHRFLDSRYELDGFAIASDVRGTQPFITALQQGPGHEYQRPDDRLRVDPSATALRGDGEQLELSKIAGGHTRFTTVYERFSPGLELNDLGFLPQSNRQLMSNWFQLQWLTPRAFYRRLSVNFNEWNDWTTEGLLTESGGNANANVMFPNSATLTLGAGADNVGAVYCDVCARGGPAVRQDPVPNAFLFFEGDQRRTVIPSLSATWSTGDRGASRSANLSVGASIRPSSRLTLTVAPSFYDAVVAHQWVANYPAGQIDADPHYVFGHLDVRSLGIETRADLAMTPTLTFQLYAQPFFDAGTFTGFHELTTAPRSADPDARYQPFGSSSLPPTLQFNDRAFNSNAVLRWEYRPGSTLYLVWSQQRQPVGPLPVDGTLGVRRDFGYLFDRMRPDNTLLIKASYWLDL